MKIAVTINDASMAANVGGSVAYETRTFPMPPEIAELVKKWTGLYMHCQLTICTDDEDRTP